MKGLMVMPNKQLEAFRVPRTKGKDRRIKLSEDEKREILDAYSAGASINGLARQHGVSKRTIQFLLFPERKQKNLEDRERRGGSKIYYDKVKHKKFMADHREHKRKLLSDTQHL